MLRDDGGDNGQIGGVEPNYAVERSRGAVTYVDPLTEKLHHLADSYAFFLRARIGETNRGALPWLPESLEEIERKLSRELSKALRKHALWPWLERFPGLGGVHVASFIGRMRDPMRFRGPRSLWHYAGLHVVDGRLPRYTKGIKADWNPKMRAAVLQPGGIAEQIVRLRVPHYRDVYDQQKARIIQERGLVAPCGERDEMDGEALVKRKTRGRVEDRSEIETLPGTVPAKNRLVGTDGERERHSGEPQTTGAVEAQPGNVNARGRSRRKGTEQIEARRVDDTSRGPLRPFQVEQRARIIAGKRFVGDLLKEWQRLVGCYLASVVAGGEA